MSGGKATKGHPSYPEMIVAGIAQFNDARGCRVQQISKYILTHYDLQDDGNMRMRVRLALGRGIKLGTLVKVRGRYLMVTEDKPAAAPPASLTTNANDAIPTCAAQTSQQQQQ